MPSPFARRDDPSLADPLPECPEPLLGAWLEEAMQKRPVPNPLAMGLATLGVDGNPTSRMVICRGYDLEAGWLVFYTDRRSAKGEELARHPRAAALLHWDALQRQVRIEGPVTEAPEEQSDAYFRSRPLDHQLAASVSEQSRPVASRAELVARMDQALVERGIDLSDPNSGPLPRPSFWGGYRLWIERLELWLGQPGRVHDRALWTRKLTPRAEGFAAGAWRIERLQP